MGIKDALEFAGKEGRTVLSAPVSFATAATIIIAGTWAVTNYFYQHKIEDLESRLKLKDDQIIDYKDKLNGATPIEAKSRIDTLENQVKALLPRHISQEQKRVMASVLKNTKSVILFGQDVSASDAKQLVTDFSDIFSMLGWDTRVAIIGAMRNPPRSGVALRVQNKDQLTSVEQTVKLALQASGVAFDIQNGVEKRQDPENPVEDFTNPFHAPSPEVEILVTTKSD